MNKQTDKSAFYLNNEALPTAKAEFEWTPEMVKGLAKAQKDIVYFAENFFYIINLDRGKEIIQLFKFQKRVLKSLSKNNRVVLLASRQSGKTTMMSVFALWYICFNKDKNVLLVANKEKTAIEILGRVRTAYELLPNWLKPGVVDYSKTNMLLANGSRIFISTTASTAARGSSINCLILEECVDGDTKITIRNKKTNEIRQIPIKDLFIENYT